VLTVARGLLLYAGEETSESGEPAPLAGACILQRGPPDQAAVLACGLPAAQQVDTILPRLGHRAHLGLLQKAY